MSEILQTGQHPDADQLNAFVEHTLPAHEQEQTLAHLAACPACRQIVALSLPPAGETPILQPAVRHRWFPQWHPAWVGIPALAALILVILFVRNGERRVGQGSVPAQIADARKPAVPLVESAPPETDSGVARNVPRNGAQLAQRARQKRPGAAETQPAPLAETRSGLASDSAGAVSGGSMGGILGGVAIRPTQPATPGRAFSASSPTVGASAVAIDRVHAVLSAPRPLPSRLAILSMASHGNRRLAIDTDNHLFLSEDEGRNWKAVPAPWKGRAVAVALTSHFSSGNEAPALKMSFRPAATGGALSGTITDPSGAVIPGVTVVATNSAAAIVRSVTTDDHGQFRMEDLVPGHYRIEAQASGFETQSFATEVAPSQQAVADVTLRVGSAAQSVTVEASANPTENSPTNANLTAQPPAIETPSRFELTTEDGERWMSTDGQSWTRE